MAENNIYLIWSGHITPEVGKEVISFTDVSLCLGYTALFIILSYIILRRRDI